MLSAAPARAGVQSSRRFTAAHPCPVCGGYDLMPRGRGVRCWGFLSDDVEWAHCVREEYAGELQMHPGSETYSHRLKGPCRCGGEHSPGSIDARTLGSPARQRRRSLSVAPQGTIDCFYVYRDSDGNPAHRTVRYRDPKSFRQQRYERGQWRWGLRGVTPLLYRLPELLAAAPDRPVFLTEGERDADRLAGLGLVATTHVNGAKSWRSHYAHWLVDRHVVLLEDNDEDGQRHSQAALHDLRPIARSARVIQFPGLPPGGDVSDWLDRGGQVDALMEQAAR